MTDEHEPDEDLIEQMAGLASARLDPDFLEAINLILPGHSSDFYRGMFEGFLTAMVELTRVDGVPEQLERLTTLAQRAAQLCRAAK